MQAAEARIQGAVTESHQTQEEMRGILQAGIDAGRTSGAGRSLQSFCPRCTMRVSKTSASIEPYVIQSRRRFTL